MKKLFQMFRGLPPEMRMFIAMAGLGTPLGAIWMIRRFLFPNMPMMLLVLMVAGAVVVLFLLSMLIARIFGRGKRKRARKMASDLASESAAGPVGMDVAAAIKANNEKYFNAIRDMRKNIGVSIYDLPWYIVIGDSGCGKTKLVNEGGLQFPTGKPEGYQLGTLNYNWWFTEDAVFIDMAGRLCNPQADEDRREWEAFLGTIAKGRRGFPINGALVCVSADHLLQDPPEKIEQDANTTLERMRDLQTRLGVTFATYLVVTKCDKIVGFMQFFDRAERDITVLNQMVGWSKPGEFHEPNNPDVFSEEFDTLYRRLNDLRLRRLNDEVDEIDLGLAYSFPEEFRELRAPLQTYIRTLFPLIKNPRAIKNLIFRGVYFTSATREGALILKHITERLGPEVAEQFAPLDLYPSKRPYFIKDLLFRKMFPEHGLVFRNEQQAVRNRKLARLLTYGSIVLAVALIGALWMSSVKFGRIINEPRRRAEETRPLEPAREPQALVKAGVLQGDIGNLRQNKFWATILSLGFGRDRPVHDLGTIQAALFERVLLRRGLIDISDALRSPELPPPGAGGGEQKLGRQYMDAVKEYVTWFGCIDAGAPRDYVTYDGFETLCKVVKKGDSPIVTAREDFLNQAKNYFACVKERDDWKNPARLLNDPTAIQPIETIRAAMDNVKGYLLAYARLTENHPDRVVREWMRIRAACEGLEGSYGSILDASGGDLDTKEGFSDFTTRFGGAYETFARSLEGCLWRDELVGVQDLRPAILDQRKHWLDYEGGLKTAYSQCQTVPDDRVTAALASLTQGYPAAHVPGLDQSLWDSIQSAGLTTRDYRLGLFEKESFDKYVDEAIVAYGHILEMVPGGETGSDRLQLADAVGVVRDALSRIETRLRDADLEPSDDPGVPQDWNARLEEILDMEEQPEGAADRPSLASLPDVWRPRDLADLFDVHEQLIARGQGRALLETIHNALTDPGEWGLVHLYRDQGAFDLEPSGYYISPPVSAEQDLAPEVRKSSKDKEPRPKRRRSSRRRGRSRDHERTAVRTSTISLEGDGQVPKCMRGRYLNDRAEECRALLWNLEDFNPEFFLGSVTDPDDLNRVCDRRLQEAIEVYMRAYVRGWSEAYRQKDLRTLEKLSERCDNWATLAEGLGRLASDRGRRYEEVSSELQRALGEILEAIPFWGWWFEQGEWASENELDDAKWQQLVRWMGSAIKSDWDPSLGRFAGQARRPASDEIQRAKRRDAPWIALADEFALRWEQLAKGITDNAELPSEFTAKPSDKSREEREIPWGRIHALREDAQLEDEKLTARLVAFELEAQQLLNVELTNILWNLQHSRFPNERVDEGWPYLYSGSGEDTTLETVDFRQFTEFLRQVRLAKQHLEPLEKDLPEGDELLIARRRFYRQCNAWYEFLGLSDAQLVPQDLAVEIDGDDPISVGSGKVQVDDTAQHYYGAVELDLGLDVQDQDGRYDKAPVRIATEAEERGRAGTRSARWTWEEDTGERSLVFRLVDGHPTQGGDRRYVNLADLLGHASPLALPAYLHRYGKVGGSRTDWITTHAVNVPEGLHKEGQGDLAEEIRKTGDVMFGLSFRIELDRALPSPIAVLERAN